MTGVEYHDLPPARGRKDRYVVVNRRPNGAILCIEHGTSATTGWDAVPESVLILPSADVRPRAAEVAA